MNDACETVFFIRSTGREEPRRLQGVCGFAQSRDWHVYVVDRLRDRQTMRRLVDFWKPVGCIAEGVFDPEVIVPSAIRNVPIVFCDVKPDLSDGGPWKGRASLVRHETSVLVETAFAELLRCGAKGFAYVGTIEPTYWSGERSLLMRSLAEAAGGSYREFGVAPERRFSDAVEFQKRLRTWMSQLPPQCGLLAANDFMAEQVIIASRYLDMDLPRRLAVVGIDNEEWRCENLRPTLTSVEPDFYRAGWMSAKMLDDMLAGRVRAGTSLHYGLARIVRRQSTAMMNLCDPAIAAALERIRLESCRGLKASEVLADMGCCRSKAERLFRKATGHSVGEMIERRRLEEAQHRLLSSDAKISAIANFCGYSSTSFLRRRFAETFGMSMSDWRLAQAQLLKSGKGKPE